ncbi:MAG: glucose-6-phosphate isomerase, partial [Pontixanthobacter sp.]
MTSDSAGAAHARGIWNEIEGLPRTTLNDLFAQAGRVERLSDRWTGVGDIDGGSGGGILFDWSKTHLDDALLDRFEQLAETMDFAGKRAAMLEGDAINVTEGRAAEHTAQRGIGRDSSVEEAAALHARMRMLIDAIEGGVMGDIKHCIHIGIGGSALGPALA